MIPTSSIAANPSASVATESLMEVIARLEKQITTLNLLVAQYQDASLNQTPDARQRGPFPLCIQLRVSFIKEIIFPAFNKLKEPHSLI